MTTVLDLFPWTKESPLGWSVIRVKFCLLDGREGSRIGPFGSALSLSEMAPKGYKVYGQENIIAKSFSAGKRFISEEKFKEMEIYSVRPQDILITMMGTVGQCKIVPDNIQKGIIDSHLLRLRTRADLVDLSYFEWVIGQSSVSKDQSFLVSKGSIMSGLNSGTVRDILIPLPPLKTQKLIANFLDRKTAAINSLIAKKQRLIQLLEEKRTALINQVVTKGLNPIAPMKDSGIPWIGEIPEHWQVKRLKFIAQVRGGVAKGRDLKDKNTVELPYLRVANVQDGYLDLSDISTIAIEVHEEKRYLLNQGDILMNEGGDDDKLGRGAVWDAQIERCIHQNHVFAVRPFRSINSHWINLATQASYLKHFFLVRSKKTTNLASISSTNLKESPILFPPIHEQQEILVKVYEKIEQIQNIDRAIAFQIQKLQEYRQSLITAAVTGKLDISEVDPDV